MVSDEKTKKRRKILQDSGLAGDIDESQKIAESLYKKNIELLTKNKTLSLLSKLYEISILTLNPKELSARISETVQVDLSFELVGILTLESKSDSLMPLAFSKSQRVKTTLEKLKFSFEDLIIPEISSRNFFKNVIVSRAENKSDNLEEVWGNLIDKTSLQTMIAEDHIKTTLLYPLAVESKVLGSIVLALNRSYEALSSFEKESIKSFVNLIALALEKSLLYQELQDANIKLRELDRQKDELLSIVSHQLNAPVTAIKWYLELLTDAGINTLNKEQVDSVKNMQAITVNLADLVGMILDVSRIQLGKVKVDPQPLDVEAFFKEVLSVIEPKAKEKQQNFVVDMPKTLPTVLLDKRLTRMTVENLLTNAVKYTPEKGNVKFIVENRGDMLHCEVHDTGCGIPKAEQEKVFDKLYRATNVRNKVEGNGFGLFAAKGAIEAQGGKIWFESEEGKGTKFFIELPLVYPKTA